MTPITTEQAALNEERWQEWLAKGRRRDRANAKKFKVVAGIIVLLASLVAFYLIR